MVPIHAGHFLLGRPWQFDQRVKHDGFVNQYTFKHHGKSVTLVSLLPKQVFEDQQRLNISMEQMREKEKGKNVKVKKDEKLRGKIQDCEKNMSRGKEGEIKNEKSEKERSILTNQCASRLCVFPSIQVSKGLSGEMQLQYLLNER